ncbi:MAG TPA: XRE family transcriptional regulator [Solirubrobacterales bacterium]|nr:XRE family transcriptional regulator [Solirubrobacterales bacterium]
MGDFNYNRVDLARRRRGFTKGALAKAVGISPRNLNAYEKDQQEPTPQTVSHFASALGFPREFFFGPDLDEPTPEGASFRALSRLTARQRDQALGSGALALALGDWIDEHFNLPAPDVPQHPGLDPEMAADAVRSAWGLGEKRIPNMVHLLEAHGVRVFSLSEDSTTVDAFSFWRGRIPYVFLNTKKTAEHSRMDAAHELGHLVLHGHGGPRGRQAEHEAQAFGAAFLMPAGSVRAEAPRAARMPQLIKAKGRWNVSVANLAVRMHRLGLLSDWQYRSIFIELNRRGRANEPTAPGKDPLPQERSQILEKVFRALRGENVSKASVAQTLHIPLQDLNDSVFGLVLTPIIGTDNPQPVPGHSRPELRVV